jgi:hypothetical protein
MYIKKLCILLLAILGALVSQAQSLEVFKIKIENVGYRYGLRDNTTNETIIEATYKTLYFIGDSSYIQVQNDAQKIGILDLKGNTVIPLDYEGIISTSIDVLKARKDGKFGLIDINNKVLTPFEYDWIMYETKPIRVGKKNGLFGTFNRKNETIIPFEYESLSPSGNYYIATQKSRFGLFNKSGETVVTTQYSKIRSEFNNVFVVENLDSQAIIKPEISKKLEFKYSYVGKSYKDLICAAKAQQHGVLDSNLNQIVPFHFKNPISVHANILRVDSANYFGYFSRAGKRLTKIQYIGHPRFVHGWYLLESHRHQALVDITGEHQERFEYKYINIVDANKAAVQEDEHFWTVRDIRSNTIIGGKSYEYISRFNNGIGYARARNGKILLMNSKLEELTPALYTWIFLKDDYAEVWIGDKKGVVSLKGRMITLVIYESVSPQNGFYNCRTKKGVDIYSKSGKRLFEKRYSHLINVGDGKFMAYKWRRWGVLDSNGTEVIPFKYKNISIPQNGMLAGMVKNTWYVTDYNGKEVFHYKCDRIGFVEGLYTVQHKKKWGAVNGQGELVIPIEYDVIKRAEKGGLEVRKNGRYGIYNNKGELLLPVEFNKIEQYVNGLARVVKDGKWAFINSQGKLICEPIYDEAFTFYMSYAVVTKDGKQGLMHSSGKLIIEPKYELVYYVRRNERLVDVKQDGLLGLMNLNGEWVLEPKFTTIGINKSSNLVITMLETDGIRKYGVLSNKGEEIIPAVYDEIQFDNLRILATKNGVVMQFSLQGECLNCD